MNIRTNQPTVDASSTTSLLPSSDAATYFSDKNEFPNYLNTLISRGNFAATIGFLEVYFSKYPLFRQTLLQLHSQLVASGQTRFAREVCRIYADTCDYLLKIGKSELGLPGVFDSQWALGPSNLYEIVDFAGYTFHIKQLGLTKDKPVLLFSSKQPQANLALLPYLEENFQVIRNETDIEHYRRVANLSPFNCAFYHISDTQYGSINSFYGEVYPELMNKGLNPFSLKLKAETRNTAFKFLKDFSLVEEEFVVLHLHEETDNKSADTNRTHRNVKPEDYIKAVEWLLSQGLKVVRIGCSKTTPLPEMKGLIDLTKVDKPDEVDIYLCAKAKFFYGTNGGPISLATHFGTKVLLSNSIDYGISRPNTLIQLRPIELANDGQVLPISEIERLNLDFITVDSAFSNRGVRPGYLSSEDHLRSVKEMVQFIEEGDILRSNEEMRTQTGRQNLLSNFVSDSLKFFWK